MTEPPTTPRTYSPREFAAEIGVSERTVYREIQRGHIRAAKIGQLLRIPRTELDRLLGGEAA